MYCQFGLKKGGMDFCHLVCVNSVCILRGMIKIWMKKEKKRNMTYIFFLRLTLAESVRSPSPVKSPSSPPSPSSHVYRTHTNVLTLHDQSFRLLTTMKPKSICANLCYLLYEHKFEKKSPTLLLCIAASH